MLAVSLLAAFVAVGADAKVFYSQREALEMAFPGAEEVASKTFVLDDDQVERIESLAKCDLDSKLVKIYTGKRDGKVLGYALIDIHNVRTLPEAFMVVLNPEGEVRSLRVLAFHEPLEYKPTNRWYKQFDNQSIGAPLRVGRDIHGVVGATLSTRATTRGVRRALAYYEVLLQSEE
ncbi:MAG: FMN-binding protein [Deltaproteobacteria bacterium]|nr:FMN-binding protein [Deltaproteobacteria bacterium]